MCDAIIQMSWVRGFLRRFPHPDALTIPTGSGLPTPRQKDHQKLKWLHRRIIAEVLLGHSTSAYNPLLFSESQP